jgi:hypothetical protein
MTRLPTNNLPLPPEPLFGRKSAEALADFGFWISDGSLGWQLYDKKTGGENAECIPHY